ncbi:unnamed protein product [Bursaphelenchus xylophilus]|uniref:Beta-glucuronidase n=1 Tax=Bursaphelenchus xylophilus TaxID=6326 RepID=A0A7I8XIZ6_BURXY|nr:unnamed protein product [Bursaphelenchus xylophilus]CAG9125276.1 unnamed protein product [Bursaphelenchus xylophilus]
MMRTSLLISELILCCSGLLYPQRNEIRGLDSLDGLWTFVREPPLAFNLGIINKWFQRDLAKFSNATRMPVPAAFNDLLTDRDARNHVGWVWYQTIYYRRASDASKRLILRFGAVNYRAIVYINGQEAGQHVGGYLPFEIELPENTIEYVITVAVNNILNGGTIPQGTYTGGRFGNVSYAYDRANCDFFNYAGILRPVSVQVLDKVYLNSLKITTEGPNILNYSLTVDNTKLPIIIYMTLYDPDGKRVQQVKWPAPFKPIENVQFWWPRGYGEAKLYKLQIKVTSQGQVLDSYTESFGFRTVEFKSRQIFLHGRAYNPVGITKDLNMFEWLHSNCYRTSHYPYTEERAYEADRRGIMVITEAPAVSLSTFNNPRMLALHKQMIHEMISRDQNHPSVMAWSLANEPLSWNSGAGAYFKNITAYARSLDNRPLGVIYGASGDFSDNQKTAETLDFFGINHYDGWYTHLDMMDLLETGMYKTMKSAHNLYPDKVLFITEYGAEALPGYSQVQGAPFTEQYQHDVLKENFNAIDRLKDETIIAGEMIWTFADFMTHPDTTRAYGNHKGVLTRQRQPKRSAYLVRRRYKNIFKELQSL